MDRLLALLMRCFFCAVPALVLALVLWFARGGLFAGLAFGATFWAGWDLTRPRPEREEF